MIPIPKLFLVISTLILIYSCKEKQIIRNEMAISQIDLFATPRIDNINGIQIINIDNFIYQNECIKLRRKDAHYLSEINKDSLTYYYYENIRDTTFLKEMEKFLYDIDQSKENETFVNKEDLNPKIYTDIKLVLKLYRSNPILNPALIGLNQNRDAFYKGRLFEVPKDLLEKLYQYLPEELALNWKNEYSTEKLYDKVILIDSSNILNVKVDTISYNKPL